MKFDYLRLWKNNAKQKLEGRGNNLLFLLDNPVNSNDLVFDFHHHTTSSDGARDVKKVLLDASINGVEKISLTDHDTILSYIEIMDDRDVVDKFDGEIIPGVEITSRLQGDAVETLIYDFDVEKVIELINSGEFPFLNREFKINRFVELLSQRLDIVNGLGLTEIPLNLGDFITIKKCEESALPQTLNQSQFNIEDIILKAINDGQSIRYIKIGNDEYEINYDYFNSKLLKCLNSSDKGRKYLMDLKTTDKSTPMNFAEFNRGVIQNQNSPLFVDDSKYFPTVEQCCEFAKKCGGVAILAHPYGYNDVKTSPEELMNRAVKEGVDGIECMHGFNEPNEIEKIYKFCYEHDLMITAGSDTHGYYSSQGTETGPGIMPGQGVKSKFNNVLDGAKIGTYNVHYFGSGAWRGEAAFDIDNEYQNEK